ncbi:hypothetical protein ABFO19_09240 [Xanthomonas citri pv. glycines]|uniref:Uncharacterized protein n=1 Tax=Xanthomonas campestris pv. glycines TaxID=473421 RepID=A0AAX0I5M1_XANCG|nr:MULTISPECIES: hypothetical protein [Xanthomonas]AOY63412.1 hypothetical protein BHE84_15455 [Xanthomonas citri pv. glycines str. 8ra]OEY98638.1 hypothetical protein BIY41_09730 [Xanthomonas citri pv. glycines]OOW99966.1 hypothetical protein Xgly_03020 [Xanthomonas citri pv. glycines]QDR44937.1 hypothetical protein FPK90_09690 [Xanthomonas citri pv. glycines]QDS11407.1 hypothetical protein FPL03_09680 [Xanthomonas citri pv. glycines]
MAEIYGTRWTSGFGADPSTGAGSTWAKGLAGVTAQQLGAGLTACIAAADPWPPTLPEFRARCLGVPSLARVANELRGGGDRSGFTVLVGMKLDGYRYRGASASDADRMVREAYELARDHVMRGGEVPEPAATALPPPAKVPEVADRDAARAALARAAAELGDATAVTA